jgi:hypothetical protein
MEEKMKETTVMFRVTEGWKETIKTAAAKNGVTMSEMMIFSLRCLMTGETPSFQKLRDELNGKFEPRHVEQHLAELRDDLGEESEMEKFFKANGAIDNEGRFIAVG